MRIIPSTGRPTDCTLSRAKDLVPGVPDEKITASSYWRADHAAHNGRLDTLYDDGVSAGACIPDAYNTDQYIQVIE
jgi:hypothetical protein